MNTLHRKHQGACNHKVPLFAGLLALGIILTSSSRADLIYMKDGFVIEGKVRRDHQLELDPTTKEPVSYPRGLFQVDDGTRRIHFLPSQARIAEREEATREEKFTSSKVIFIPHNRPMPSIWEIVQTDSWDENWDRGFIFKGPTGVVGLKQHMGALTPTWARVDAANRHRWGCMYLTREFSDATLRGLLDSNPESTDKAGLPAADRISRKMRRIDFWLQAGRFAEASRETESLKSLGPDTQKQASEATATIARVRAREDLEKIKLLVNGHQFKQAGKALQTFPEQAAADKVASEYRSIRSDMDALSERERECLELLTWTESGLKAQDELKRPLSELKTEFHPDGMERLEIFLGQARSARKAAGNKEPGERAGELAALAVTGWYVGNAGADKSAIVASELASLRRLMIQYLASKDPNQRASILGQIRQLLTRRKFEDLCLMLPHLPPVQPESNPATTLREVQPPPTEPGAPRYAIQVPPDYHHGRAWPVLVALHASGETLADHAAKWSKAAADNGYILLLPLWEIGGPKAGYAYSPREHDAVLDAIRAVKMTHNVDSDRVFLFGFESGANAAFDIGLSHPDHFAGVMPMSGGGFYFSQAYWRNAQSTPFYVVNGDYSGELNAKNRDIFSNWAGRSFNMLWIQYKGRGIEWFAGEVPNIFDWMRVKKRSFPLNALGNVGGGPLGTEFRTSRPTDNRFFWLQADELMPSSQNTGMRYNPAVSPATLSGWIDPATNKAYLKTTGCSQVRLLICRNAKGESLLRLDKPVSIQHQLRTIWNQKKVEPSLETLMEDQRLRGDRSVQVMLDATFKP